MIHFFKKPVSHLALPEKFTYPFHYTPHPLCVLAAEEVKEYIASRKEWQEELASGKMFGVLIVQTNNRITNNEENQIGYLAAFSGNLDGKNLHPYFVPPVYDLLQPEGFFKIEEEQISAINIRIRELENSSSYLDSKEKWKIETEQAKAVLNQAKAELKMAKEASAYDSAFMFKYSERPGTYASKHLPDDVPEEIKIRRLNEMIELQNQLSAESNAKDVGKTFEVLVEGVSKRSKEQLFGRTEQNKVVVFDRGSHRIGDFVKVKITESSSATLKGIEVTE